VLTGPFAALPTALEILDTVRRAREVARARGITIDNVEELRLRFDGLAGVKNDLAGAGWTSLCLYTDGGIYPSASMAGVPELKCGGLLDQSLETVWKESAVLRELRGTTVEQKVQCRSCHLKFLCGGGDFEHGYWASSGASGRGSFAGHDPYCEVCQGLAGGDTRRRRRGRPRDGAAAIRLRPPGRLPRHGRTDAPRRTGGRADDALGVRAVGGGGGSVARGGAAVLRPRCRTAAGGVVLSRPARGGGPRAHSA
jgi:radical SAM protein with 4Fe4S-binding SPASM domain